MQPEPTVSCEFLNSEAVFVGAVISTQSEPSQGEYTDGWLYDLTVQELFRGPQTNTIEVFTGNDSARFPLELGKQYLLFASTYEGRLVITCCGNSALASDAQATIERLRGIVVPQDALIEGRISFSGIPDTGAHTPGIRVVIRGGGRTFSATSDRNGWFHLHVPPGKYTAKVHQTPHWTIEAYDLSYDDPNDFQARAGHGTGLEFRAY